MKKRKVDRYISNRRAVLNNNNIIARQIYLAWYSWTLYIRAINKVLKRRMNNSVSTVRSLFTFVMFLYVPKDQPNKISISKISSKII